MRLAPYPDLKAWPKDRPARVTMRFADGGEMSAVCESARGGADQPFDEQTLLAKLAENAAGVFPAAPDTPGPRHSRRCVRSPPGRGAKSLADMVRT